MRLLGGVQFQAATDIAAESSTGPETAKVDEEAVSNASELVSLEHTGVGYFLTLRHGSFPVEPVTLTKPYVDGRTEDAFHTDGRRRLGSPTRGRHERGRAVLLTRYRGRFNVKLIALFFTALLYPVGTASAQSLAFTDVTVIDVKEGVAEPGVTVIVSGDRIWGIGKTDSLEVPAGATSIDATGKYLIPGLWDMHAHLDDALWKSGYNTTEEKETFLTLLVARGITGVRLMGDFIEQVNAWRQRILLGDLLGPRIVAADRPLEGGELPFTGWVSVETEAEGREAVRSAIRRGADFIKVYDGLSRDAYFAIADEAHRLGVDFAGHPPYVVTAAEAAETGQKSIEHLTGTTYLCTDSAAVFQEEIERAVAEEGRSLTNHPVHGVYLGWDARIAASFNPDRCRDMLAAFVEHETWHVPTLTVFAGLREWVARGDEGRRGPDPRERYLPSSVPAYWRANYQIPAAALPLFEAGANTAFRMTGALHEAGVRLMAGTDFATVPYVVPGLSLHEELEHLVAAGLTPMEALQTATLNPAEYLGRAHSGGTIEIGQLADLVLLEGDPLQDITNTRRISAVVLNGRLLDRGDLDAMLAEVERLVGE